MSRYRTVEVRVWRDEKFLSLSEPSQLLWMYLLTCPEGLAIPGVIVGGPAALGESLGWTPDQLRERFNELADRGMAKADWRRRLVWLPNAAKHRPPANGNVIAGWADQWDELPDCELKREVWQTLAAVCARWPQQFLDAFPEPRGNGSPNPSSYRSPNPSPYPSPNPSPTQEQDQEQDQEQEGEMSRADAPRPIRSLPATVDHLGEDPPVANSRAEGTSLALVPVEPEADPVRDFADAAVEVLNRATGHNYRADSEAVLKNVRVLVRKRYTPDDAIAVVEAKVAAWKGDPKMAEYLRPATLLRPSNFAGYVEDLRAGNKPGAPTRRPPMERRSALDGVLDLIRRTEAEECHDAC